MITLDCIRKEIDEILERGRMTSQSVADLMALYYLEDKLGGKASERRGSMDLETAQKWTRHMRNADGSMGEHWTFEQTNQVLKQRGFDCQSPEFYATMNMLWSDYSKVAEKFGVNNMDFWAALSHAFLMDEDAEPGKLELYHRYVAGK